MNVYVSLNEIKSLLGMNLSDTERDNVLMLLLNRTSRRADKYCNRYFYCELATKTIWIAESSSCISIDDLILITTLKEITTSGVESTIASTSYDLQPLSGYPKTSIRLKTGNFTQGNKLEITGKFGHSDTKDGSGDTVQNDPLTSSSTLLSVTNGKNFSIGQTLHLESEQVYVIAIGANVLTIKRAINGTTGASHIKTTSIYIQLYPEGVSEGVSMLAILQYRGVEAKSEGTDTESAIPGRALPPEVKAAWNNYVRYEIR